MRTLRSPDIRRAIHEGRTVMCTPYSPEAPFSVGNAMGRNKLIYALSDLTLVVAAEVETGGSWSAAAEGHLPLRETVELEGESSVTLTMIPCHQTGLASRDTSQTGRERQANHRQGRRTGREETLAVQFRRIAPRQLLWGFPVRR